MSWGGYHCSVRLCFQMHMNTHWGLHRAFQAAGLIDLHHLSVVNPVLSYEHLYDKFKLYTAEYLYTCSSKQSTHRPITSQHCDAYNLMETAQELQLILTSTLTMIWLLVAGELCWAPEIFTYGLKSSCSYWSLINYKSSNRKKWMSHNRWEPCKTMKAKADLVHHLMASSGLCTSPLVWIQESADGKPAEIMWCNRVNTELSLRGASPTSWWVHATKSWERPSVSVALIREALLRSCLPLWL